MAKKQREPVLAKHTRTLFSNGKRSPLTLKDHSQIPIILDTLSRKENHHILLQGTSSDIFNVAFLESIAARLVEEQAPKALRDAFFFFLDIDSLALSNADPQLLEQDLLVLHKEICDTQKRIIVALNQALPLVTEENDTALGVLSKFLRSVLANDQWRLFIVTDKMDHALLQDEHYVNRFFSTIKLNEPSQTDCLKILKTYHRELEDFHHVVIPQEAFTFSFALAGNYLGGQSILEKSLQLLDSGAARASMTERNDDPTGKLKPILTNTILASVVSSWANIPLSHLQENKFKVTEFTHFMHQHIFGQEAAINLMGLTLQYARTKIQNKAGPLCNFLLVGPAHVGKAATAAIMAEQLFGHKKALLRVNLDKPHYSIADVKIYQTDQDEQITLCEAIQQIPYAVILIENINQAPASTMSLFQEILTQGYTFDEQGHKYDFRHAIVVMTTSLGSDRIVNTNQPQPADLMQLVLEECSHDSPLPHQQYLSQQEICEEIYPSLEPYFSEKTLAHLNIIPFAPLDYTALEKIIRLKVKALSRQLDLTFGIELIYAPEVLRFLVQEALWRGKSTRPIDKVLEQHLHFCVTHEVLSHSEDKHRSNRLSLQLNDSGQFLICEFVSQNEVALQDH